MFSKGLLKRLVPFFLALGVGLFVASFFVSIALPNIRFGRQWRSHREYHRQMEFENQRLRMENCRLRKEVRIQQTQDFDGDINELVPPPPPLAPVAPRSLK